MPAARSTHRLLVAAFSPLSRGYISNRSDELDETNPRPQALLLDYGGVLTTSIHGAFAEFCGREQIELSAFQAALGAALTDPESPAARVETGALDPAAFDLEMAALLSRHIGTTVDPVGLTARMFENVRTETRMVDAVHAIRAAGTPVVLVSNSWGGAAYDQSVIDSLFDHVIISGKVGLRKPDAPIYELAAERAGVPANRCVFVDDLPLNCDGARAVGMSAIHHLEPNATIPTLHQLFPT